MSLYINIAQIIVGVALIGIILLQVRSGGLAGVFGGVQTSFQRVRRGVERTLFIVTVLLAFLFFIIALVNALAAQALP